MSEHFPGKERLPNQPNVGEVRKLVEAASEILEKEILEGRTRTYFDDPSELIKRAGLNATGETVPTVLAELNIAEGTFVIDKSHENVRNPYITFILLEPHLTGGMAYETETVLRIELKTLYGLKDEQELPAEAAATWVEVHDADNQRGSDDLNDGFEDVAWQVEDAQSRELDRETFERFKNIIAEL